MKVNTVLIIIAIIALIAPIVYLFRNIQTTNSPSEDEMLWI
jgi:flagellar biogenesis protein FliO